MSVFSLGVLFVGAVASVEYGLPLCIPAPVGLVLALPLLDCQVILMSDLSTCHICWWKG